MSAPDRQRNGGSVSLQGALGDTTLRVWAELGRARMPLGKALSINGAFNRPGTIPFRGGNVFNSRAVHAAEVPAAAGICDARSLARMYAACIGEVDGVRLRAEKVTGRRIGRVVISRKAS